MLALTKIRIDGGTQSRERLNEEVVAEYAEAYEAGDKFPPVTVFFDGSDFWLADGFHRFFAAQKAGVKLLDAKEVVGTLRDAKLFSLSANAKHGLNRSNADKRKAVMAMLEDEEWSKWSSREIAKACSVSHTFVDSAKASLATVASEKPKEVTYINKHGTVAAMKTANIGKAAPSKAEASCPKASVKAEPVAEPEEAQFDPREYELDELRETIRTLADENTALKDQISAGLMPGSDEDRNAVTETIRDLRETVRTLRIEVDALRQSRDTFQHEAAQMKIQLASQRRMLAKLQREEVAA
jgi:regulator of replication initiation timing